MKDFVPWSYGFNKVHTSQNYWGFGLFPSSGILKNRTHDVSETGFVCPQVRGEDTSQLGPLERANLNPMMIFSAVQ
jgi:hypothetical protein